MRIPVIFPDQGRGIVRSEELQEMIDSKKISAFYRYTEFVDVVVDPVRGSGGKKYAGPERRGNLQNY
jgi:hypothetical protein